MKKVVALFDKVSGLYMQPFFVPAIGVAVRQLQDEFKRVGEDNVLAKHPGDFSLWHIGDWDDEKGVLIPFGPDKTCDVLDIVNVQEGA